MKQIELGLEVEADLRRSRRELGQDDPWFGRVDLETAEGPFSYRVRRGPRSGSDAVETGGSGPAPEPGASASSEPPVIDWRHPASAPLFDPPSTSEPVSVRIGQRTVSGRLRSRARVHGPLSRPSVQAELFPTAAEPGEAEPPTPLPRSTSPQVEPQTGLPDILGLVTPEQYRLITSTRDRPVVLLGRAGSGKTTVALYRVSWLTYPHGDRPGIDPSDVLIVMFNRALRDFVSQLLQPLGLEGAHIDTFHGWALEQVRLACNHPLEVKADIDPEFRAQATQVKRNAGMPAAIGAFVEQQRERLIEWLHERLDPYGASEIAERVRERGGPPVQSLHTEWSDAQHARDTSRGVERQRLEQVCRVLERSVHRMTRYPEELLALLSDRPLLQTHLRNVPPWDIDMTARHQRMMMTRSSSRPRPASRSELGPGPTPIGFDDFALLLQLIERKNGGLVDRRHPGVPRRYAHLVIDEAQDFGPVELDTLFRVVRGPSDVTIVGDLNQKIVPDAAFMGWTTVARRLGLDRAAVAQLEVAHRSTGPIMHLAEHLIEASPTAGRPGPVPTLDRVDDEDARDTILIERLGRRQAEQPHAHQCVVCRHREQAEALYDRIEPRLTAGGVPVRLGHNRSFVFAPGVTISNLRQLKGLEFDTVTLVDPDEAAYPASEESRRYLYTLVTRARERLHVVSSVPICGLLQAAVDAGRIDVEEPGTVQPALFEPEDDQPL